MTESNMEGATATDIAAADWVQRRNLWSWTESDQREFDAWRAESDAHHVAYLRQNAVWQIAERLNALRHQLPMRPRPPATKSRKWTLLRAAALACVALAVGVTGIVALDHPADVTYQTPVGGHKVIVLADGTRIELNTNSALQISGATARRVALLHGEAYFDVHHDGTDAFAVTANGYRITDIGTKFSIRASAGAIKVSLLEGSAVVSPLTGQKTRRSALLMPGDVAIADAQVLRIEKEPVASVASSLGWRRGLLTFKDTELAEAIAEFNRYNTHKLRIADDAAMRLKINGTFQAENADLFASSMQELFGLRINRNANETTLSR